MASAAVAAVVSTSGTSAEAETSPALPVLRSSPAWKKLILQGLNVISCSISSDAQAAQGITTP